MEKTFMDDLDRNIFPYVEYPGYPFRYPTHLPLIVTRKQIEEVRQVSGALYGILPKRYAGPWSAVILSWMTWKFLRNSGNISMAAMP